MSARKKLKVDISNNHSIVDMFKRTAEALERRNSTSSPTVSSNSSQRPASTPMSPINVQDENKIEPSKVSQISKNSPPGTPRTNKQPDAFHTPTRPIPYQPKVTPRLSTQSPRTPQSKMVKNSEELNASSSDTIQFPHLSYKFLHPPNRLDIHENHPDDPDYDEKTLYVPQHFLDSQTPALRQWWLIKQRNMDAILFFKMGKFYELFNEDAVIGVNILEINFMKSEDGRPAHAGFPEVSYDKYSKILVDRGYKVIRIEQTETPAMMEERCQETGQRSKFDKVVKREVCRITTKGTQMLGVMESVFHSPQNQYLLALYEASDDQLQSGSLKSKVFGVSFIDVSIGKLFLGQFNDDNNQSKLNMLLAHNRPTEVLYEKSNLSLDTSKTILKTGALLTPLKQSKEFWSVKKALTYLEKQHILGGEVSNNELPSSFKSMFIEGDCSDSLSSLEPKEEYKYALNSFGAIVYYLQSQLIAEQVLNCASFEIYNAPLDRHNNQKMRDEKTASAPPMILDHIVLRNLEIFENNSGGTKSTLFEGLNYCKTHFGQRLLKTWISSPQTDVKQIENRLNAVKALVNNENASLMNEITHILGQTPDLERLLSRIKSQCFKSASDSRAIMFDGNQYSRAKIISFLNLLQNFKRLQKFVSSISKSVKECNSSVLRRLLTFTTDDGLFPDYSSTLEYFESAFDHDSARKTGTITPSPGVDLAYDECLDSIEKIKGKLDEYLEEQKDILRCRHLEFFGTAKNRYQIQVPDSYCKNVPSDYRIETTRKGFKRYYTTKIDKLFQKLTTYEEKMKKTLDNIMSRIFEQFTRKFKLWQAAIECFAILDVLQSIASFVRSLKANDIDVCQPTFLKDGSSPVIEFKDGRHPVLVKLQPNFVSNDLILDERLILLSGANMGGKSTLMRQSALFVILAQIGSFVPASSMRLTPVDRIFSRLGASDRLIEGESTFYTELVETSAMLQCATSNSLLLLDELGRGTSTYDGTAIAYSVLQEISNNIKCRCLFSTHYHTLVREYEHKQGIRLAHMACEVEKYSDVDVDTDPLKENITFLYKIADGPVGRSYGFNVAKLAGIESLIIKEAYKKAKELEIGCKILEKMQELALDENLNANKSLMKQRILASLEK